MLSCPGFRTIGISGAKPGAFSWDDNLTAEHPETPVAAEN
jgi:hypothetical protein